MPTVNLICDNSKFNTFIMVDVTKLYHKKYLQKRFKRKEFLNLKELFKLKKGIFLLS